MATSLVQYLVVQLEERIRSGGYAADAQLPNESQLCEEFGASRATVREALRDLHARGLVRREQGRGTFASGSSRMRLDMELETNVSVTEVIRASQLDPGSTGLTVGYELPPANVAAALRANPRQVLMVLRRTRTADGQPVAHAVDYVVPFPGLPTDARAYEGSLYDLLADVHGRPVSFGLARIEPGVARDDVADALDCGEGALLLLLTQLHELDDTTPVAYSTVSLRSDVFALYVRRGETGTKPDPAGVEVVLSAGAVDGVDS